jgi:prevent-host-death family protein
MTRKSPAGAMPENYWKAQDVKARLSEVMRRAREAGPQHVTVHGREEAVILSAEDYRKLKGDPRTGADLIAAMQACPWPDDLVFDRVQVYPSVREINL